MRRFLFGSVVAATLFVAACGTQPNQQLDVPSGDIPNAVSSSEPKAPVPPATKAERENYCGARRVAMKNHCGMSKPEEEPGCRDHAQMDYEDCMANASDEDVGEWTTATLSVPSYTNPKK